MSRALLSERVRWLSFALLPVLLLAFTPRAECQPNAGFGISVTANRSTYRVGESMVFRLKAFNYSEPKVVIQFRTTQRGDFRIETLAGREVWRWSAGRMFGQAMGVLELGPETQEMVLEGSFAGKLPPGEYRITGFLADNEKRFAASVSVVVR